MRPLQGISTRPLLLGLLPALVWVGLASFTGGGGIAAQEFPPFPILYGGQVWINEEAAPPGTVLVVRVGDYETSAVVEEDGLYRNLLVQPNSSDYYNLPITFHTLEATAQESDTFLNSGAPEFKTAFNLHFSISETEPSPAPSAQATPSLVVVQDGASDQRSVLLIALLAVVGGVVAAGVLVTLGRRYRHQ
ncbi:MAG: hypothetical protein O7D33_05315 [Chloroflexi bacterium]|nr:hypothetical protein [Chloroflexota bacterium]